MDDQGQDKTEQKSRKKWEEARNKGELPRSRELATFILFAVLLIYFQLSRMQWFDAIGVVMADLLQFDRYLNLNAESLPDFLLQPVLKTAFFLAPFFLIVLVVAITANMGQVGFQLASQKIKIDWNRLDPMKGLKRIVSLRSLIEGLKSMLKTGFFMYLAYLTIRDAMPLVVAQAALSLRHQLNFLMEVVLKLTLRVTILMAALAIFDFGYQWWRFQNTLKMTPREVKDETKEHEGDPLIRQRMRSLRMQMARRRMMSDVANADLIVTNPAHYAVAIAYNLEKMPAPYVCAKGTRYLAQRIVEIAKREEVPIVENPPIARALYKKVKIGQMIPSEFYRAVAELLAFVYMLKNRRPSRRLTPHRPPTR